MEVISIEKRTFKEMIDRFKHLAGRMEAICGRYSEKMQDRWLDNQEVCHILQISPRSLQTLRDNGILAFSKINHKVYYRSVDVQRIVSAVKERKKENILNQGQDIK